MKAIFLAALLAVGCHGGQGPDAGPPTPVLVDAGTQVADGLCSLLDGVDDSGVLRSVCASVDEIATIVSFITSLRQATDAGVPNAAMRCANLPGTTFCATSSERAKGILFLARARQARQMLDAGADAR